MRAALEAQARDLGIEQQVQFTGALTTAQVATELARTDALVLSSYAHGNWTETQACVVQEAMLMKALVVTTKTGGVPESIPDAMKQFAVPERDAAKLAEAIITVYDMPEHDMSALAEEGRDFVAARYDIRSLNQRLLAELWECSPAN